MLLCALHGQLQVISASPGPGFAAVAALRALRSGTSDSEVAQQQALVHGFAGGGAGGAHIGARDGDLRAPARAGLQGFKTPEIT